MAWIESSDFVQGTIEVDVRGRDVQQQSFVGVAFHRRDHNTYGDFANLRITPMK